MKDTLTQMGLVILGVFIVVTVILGAGNASMKAKTESVGTKVSEEITKATNNRTNP